ncbi:MAG: DUF1572 family protein [Gemmatimonadaceae bacterium]|nr:DUF1572 family protein [Gemmatimonadaceae bacterium]
MSIEVRFIERARYYLGVEYPAKVRAAIKAMPEEAIWWRPHDEANSVGNLVMHLTGNVRQWIVSGIGGAPDARRRELEFATRGGITADALIDLLERTLSEVDATLAKVTPEQLMERRSIQGRETTVFAAIFHVVEHFSTHVGQIVWIGKMCSAPGAIRFYDDANNAAPLFLGDGRGDVD